MPYGYVRPRGYTALAKRILKRDNRICHVCGQPNADQVDAIIPESQGGTHTADNLAAIHGEPCHRDKTERERLAGTTRHARRRPAEPHPGITA